MKRKSIILVIIIAISMILLSSLLFMVISNHYQNLNNSEDNEIKEEDNNDQNDENIKEEDNNIENNQGNNDTNNESNNSELMTYKVDLEDYSMKQNGQIKFYSNNQLVNEYKCTGKECYVEPLITKCVFENGRSDCKTILGDYVLIAVNDKEDGTTLYKYNGSIYFDKVSTTIETKPSIGSGKVFLYNIKTGESQKYENIRKIMPAQEGLRLLEYADGNYMIISNDGKISSNFNKDGLVLSCYEGCALDSTRYDYDNNIIVTIKDEKYGLKKIFNNDIIIEHQYEDMQLNDSRIAHFNYELYQNKYIKVKENGKWYLYDLKNNKKVNDHGYDKLYLIDENTMIVMEDTYLYIKDYNNNLLTDEKIYVKNLFAWLPKEPEGIRIVKNKNIFTISIYDGTSYEDYKHYDYSYNIETKELKKQTGE